MKALVIGCGSIGQRHIKNLHSLGHEVFAYDSSGERLEEVMRSRQARRCSSSEDGLDRRPDVALICTPPHLHVTQARQAIAAGCHVFVEKPLGHHLRETDTLLDEVMKAGRIIYVGYNLRFHAGLSRLEQLLTKGTIGRVISIRAEFGQYLPDWRPGSNYRQSYTAHAAMGGGIILDASHELDYVRWLGEEVEAVNCTADKVSDLEMDAEDTAEITLRMEKRILAHVHLDCVQRGYSRTCKVVGETGTLIWDYETGVRHYDAHTGIWHEERIRPDPNDMYVAELKHFFNCVQGDAVPLVDGWAGRRVLEIALAAKQSARERREVALCTR